MGPIASVSSYKLTTSSRKHLEDISHPHIVSLMYKLLTSSRGSDHLSVGFDRDRTKRRCESNNRKEKYHRRNYLKDIFGFVQHQEEATYGLGYELTLTRNNENTVLNKDNAINIGKIKNNAIA